MAKVRSTIKLKNLNDLPPMSMSLSSMEVNLTSSWRNLKPVIDYAKCVGCLICWKFCPDTAIEIKNERPVINLNFCKGCGICAEECPTKCIEMEKE